MEQAHRMTRRSKTELAALARTTVEKIGSDIHRGGSVAYAQLVASELYETLRLELTETPSSDPSTRGLLAAAADQCRRSADERLSAERRLAELQAVLALLETGLRRRLSEKAASAAGAQRLRLFRVIEGGLSRAG
jgi:hypothetical protein